MEGYLPTVAIHDLQIHPRELDLIIATHGRGFWILPVRALEELTVENLSKDVYFTSPGNLYFLPKLAQDLDRLPEFYSEDTQPGTLAIRN